MAGIAVCVTNAKKQNALFMLEPVFQAPQQYFVNLFGYV
jgi:hypothetical protein